VSPHPAPGAGTLRILLAGAFDYSGLFPPAQLELPAVLANYRSYRTSADAWALGRLVVPATRLTELEGLLGESGRPEHSVLPVSAVVGADPAGDVRRIERFNRGTPRHGASVECVETKGEWASIPAEWVRYVEVPLGAGNAAALDAIAQAGAFAKIRTGGLTQEAFPPPEALIAFLAAAAERRLSFKATAGLHHPLRGSYRLTYAENPPRGMMYGYLNLLLAAAVLWIGAGSARARQALLEQDPAAIRSDADGLVWRDLRLERATLATLRSDFLHGFGSCSFREPMDELVAGGWE